MSELLEDQRLTIVEHTLIEGQSLETPAALSVEYVQPPISGDPRFLGEIASFGAIANVEALGDGAERFDVVPHSMDIDRGDIVSVIINAYRDQPGGEEAPVRTFRNLAAYMKALEAARGDLEGRLASARARVLEIQNRPLW